MKGPEAKDQYYYELVEAFKERPVLLLSEKPVVSYEEVDAVREAAGAETLYACDFAIDGIEAYEKEGYFEHDKVINIDHHSRSENFMRVVSSTNLAIEYVGSHPDFLAGSRAITHHTDCDSILSTVVMSGILPPEERFGVAAIAADHTGEQNEIADLLQALKDGPENGLWPTTAEGNEKKYLFALEQLQNLLRGKELDARADELYRRRLYERKLLRDMIESGKVKQENGVAWLKACEEKYDATLLIGLLPEAKVIFIARLENGKTVINARIGMALGAPSDLREVMTGINEPFGGRWNAGANRRKGGTDTSPEEIAHKLSAYLDQPLRRS